MAMIQTGSVANEANIWAAAPPPSEALTATTVVSVGEIPALATVEAGGEKHVLGLVRDFSRHPLLTKFLAQQPRGVQLSWVRLGPMEVLEPHVHPIDSMIVITTGSGVLLGGNAEAPLTSGDVVLVPRTCPHGFRGAAPEGFTALSFQFGERSLYGNAEDPLVRFLDEAPLPAEKVVDIDTLLSNNARYRKRFERFLEAEFVVTPWLRAKERRSSFLRYLRLWSDAFQRILFLRVVFTEHPTHAALAHQHLAEEFGHNAMLDSSGATRPAWDAAYEATLAWFQWKLLRSSDLERIVLVNLVTEGAADEFYKTLSSELDPERTSPHFKAHDGVDCAHEQMGLELLVGLPERQYAELANLQHQGWEMMTRVIHRGAELARSSVADDRVDARS